MTPGTPPQDAVAVHRGLLAVARNRKADFNAILVQYAIERLIDRLSRSVEARRFVLKGAMLFRVWAGELHRPTKDVDFLGSGEATPAAVAEAFRRICAVEVGDGLRFDLESIMTQEIREEQDYGGVRVGVVAYLAHVPITVRIDVGFGDAITPEASRHSFPTLLGHPAASILTYPPETVVAEKVEAMCKLGLVNSRMKDYADIIAISRRFEIGGDALAQAFRATFERRGTRLPTNVPIGLSREFVALSLALTLTARTCATQPTWATAPPTLLNPSQFRHSSSSSETRSVARTPRTEKCGEICSIRRAITVDVASGSSPRAKECGEICSVDRAIGVEIRGAWRARRNRRQHEVVEVSEGVR